MPKLHLPDNKKSADVTTTLLLLEKKIKYSLAILIQMI